jgi:peptidoglycan/LPS O-acetylase OafA/YrhL
MREASRWTGLDGLRALAVTAVVGTHFSFLGQGAFVGVDLFFVLSGFLITSLLVREREATGQMSLSNFWRRRALRLLPALLCAVALATLLVPWASPHLRVTTFTGLPWVFAYLGNWVVASNGPQTLGLLPHTWSLAIEEQFYVVWPIIAVLWFRHGVRARRAAILLGSIALIDALYNACAMVAWGFGPAYFRTDTHAMGLCAGCALAMAVHARKGRPISERGARMLQGSAAVAVALFAVLCIVPVSAPLTGSVVIDLGVISAVVLVTSVVLAPHAAMTRLFAAPGLVWIGARSYGIYLFHDPLALVFVQSPMFRGAAHLIATMCCVAFSIVLAAISFRFVETPFLRLKYRFEGSRRENSPGAVTDEPREGVPLLATPPGGLA